MSSPLRTTLLIGPLMLLLAAAYLIPFLGVMQWSVTMPKLGFGQYWVALSDPLVRSVLYRTVRVCLIVTAVTVVFGYLLSLLWVRGTPTQRLVAELCILIPFWISVLARAFGWLALLSSRGIINTWLTDLGVISDPLPMVRNEFGVVMGMTHYLVPFAVFPIASAMRQLDERVLMAARGMGSSRTRTFWQVFLPMTMPGIFGAALIVFVFSLGFFITPAILSGGRSVMVAELIWLRVFQSPDWGLASAISVILMVTVGLLLALMMRWQKSMVLR